MSEASRVIAITGASGEIGGYLAKHFLEQNWTTLGLDRSPLPSDAPRDLVFRRCDLTNGAATGEAIDDLVRTAGPIDVLVNCAGRIANAPLVALGPNGWTTHDFDLWADVLGSGLTAAFHATAVTVRHILEAHRKGVIVNISSVCAAGNPGQAAYSAAKAGLNGLTRALAKELGPVGIRVVGVAPGFIDTQSTRAHVPAARLTKVTNAIPLKRLGEVSEVAAAIDFVIANEYLTGTILELTGGLVL